MQELHSIRTKYGQVITAIATDGYCYMLNDCKTYERKEMDMTKGAQEL